MPSKVNVQAQFLLSKVKNRHKSTAFFDICKFLEKKNTQITEFTQHLGSSNENDAFRGEEIPVIQNFKDLI